MIRNAGSLPLPIDCSESSFVIGAKVIDDIRLSSAGALVGIEVVEG